MYRIKKLDIYIVKQFLLLFAGTFFISLFVLMMQFLWRYVDDRAYGYQGGWNIANADIASADFHHLSHHGHFVLFSEQYRSKIHKEPRSVDLIYEAEVT